MIDFGLVNWPATLILGVFQFGSYLFLRSNRNLAFPIAIMVFVLASSIAVLVTFLFPHISAIVVLTGLSLLVGIASAILIKPVNLRLLLLAFSAGLGAALVFVISQLVTRYMGFASIGFGDGQTVLGISEGFQAGVYEKPDGLVGLKRGFGLPAYQSFGFEGEYLVGFLPMVFLAAVIATYALLSNLLTSRVFLNVSFAAGMAVLLSTESVARHVYLMNTHTLAWAIFAVLLAGLLKFVDSNQDSSTWLMVSIALGTGSMARADNLLILTPSLLLLTWAARSETRLTRIGFWIATFAPFAAWASVLGFGLPGLGIFGMPVLALTAIGGGGLVIWFLEKRWASGNLIQWAAKGLLILTFSLALSLAPGTSRSLEVIFVNLFLGEGLWGATPLFLVVLYATLLVFDRGRPSQQQKWIFAFVCGTIAAIVLAKFGDGLSQAGDLGGFARIGWGDSLNRMAVYLIPGISALIFIRLSRVFMRFEPKVRIARPSKGARGSM
jgi:hypothetical protein